MNVKVRYFAALREQRGLADEEIGTDAQTPEGLYRELSSAHNFTLPLSIVKAAVNGEFAPMDRVLQTGDEVVFLPPVAGG